MHECTGGLSACRTLPHSFIGFCISEQRLEQCRRWVDILLQRPHPVPPEHLDHSTEVIKGWRKNMDRRMKTIHAVQDNAENMRRFSKLSTSRKLRNFGLYHQVETSRRRLLIRALRQ